jgi:hypothetical protein
MSHWTNDKFLEILANERSQTALNKAGEASIVAKRLARRFALGRSRVFGVTANLKELSKIYMKATLSVYRGCKSKTLLIVISARIYLFTLNVSCFDIKTHNFGIIIITPNIL